AESYEGAAMADERMIMCEINPLAFLEADEPWASATQNKPTPEEVLRFLCPAEERFDFDIEKFLARYRQISTEPERISVAPSEERILDKLIWPLRNAKGSFMVGNYLGTISLSGLVAEMVAIVLWKITDVRINGRSVTNADEKLLFGGEFEKLGQERRVSVLSAYGVIGDKARKNFDDIREVRNRYLHRWSEDHETLPTDGIRCFHAATSLVAGVIGQEVKEGRFMLNPRLIGYLDRQ
ncbi:MAG: hypothetical protein WA634_06555, partial [Silvibacterium sp.]